MPVEKDETGKEFFKTKDGRKLYSSGEIELVDYDIKENRFGEPYKLTLFKAEYSDSLYIISCSTAGFKNENMVTIARSTAPVDVLDKDSNEQKPVVISNPSTNNSNASVEASDTSFWGTLQVYLSPGNWANLALGDAYPDIQTKQALEEAQKAPYGSRYTAAATVDGVLNIMRLPEVVERIATWNWDYSADGKSKLNGFSRTIGKNNEDVFSNLSGGIPYERTRDISEQNFVAGVGSSLISGQIVGKAAQGTGTLVSKLSDGAKKLTQFIDEAIVGMQDLGATFNGTKLATVNSAPISNGALTSATSMMSKIDDQLAKLKIFVQGGQTDKVVEGTKKLQNLREKELEQSAITVEKAQKKLIAAINRARQNPSAENLGDVQSKTDIFEDAVKKAKSLDPDFTPGQVDTSRVATKAKSAEIEPPPSTVSQKTEDVLEETSDITSKSSNAADDVDNASRKPASTNGNRAETPNSQAAVKTEPVSKKPSIPGIKKNVIIVKKTTIITPPKVKDTEVYSGIVKNTKQPVTVSNGGLNNTKNVVTGKFINSTAETTLLHRLTSEFDDLKRLLDEMPTIFGANGKQEKLLEILSKIETTIDDLKAKNVSTAFADKLKETIDSPQLYDILDRFEKGEGKVGDLKKLFDFEVLKKESTFRTYGGNAASKQ